jgi:hypothetical protein
VQAESSDAALDGNIAVSSVISAHTTAFNTIRQTALLHWHAVDLGNKQDDGCDESSKHNEHEHHGATS